MSKNYYPKSMDILNELNQSDGSRMLFTIAKERPSMIVKAYEALHPKGDAWKDAIASKLKGDTPSFIQAIKEWRAATHLGLKESKEAVEQLMAERGIILK